MNSPRRRPELDGLATYSSAVPGQVPVRVRASSNESAGPADPALVAVVEQAARDAARYPQIGGGDLVARLAAATGLPSGRVVVGDGSLALLERALLAFVGAGDQVVSAWRSYEAYPLSIRVCHGEPALVPLDSAGQHDLGGMLAAIGPATRMVVVCNPNNPTGTTVPWPHLMQFLDCVPPSVLVVLDEAYVEFAGPRDPAAALDLLTGRANLLVLRTFSKAHGMAGLRDGYAMGHEELVAAVRSVSAPFPISTPAVAAACWSLDHLDQVDRRVALVVRARGQLIDQLSRHGLPWLPSAANFVWVPLAEGTGAFARACAAAGVLVRAFDGEGVRITVGHPDLEDALEPVLTTWSKLPTD